MINHPEVKKVLIGDYYYWEYKNKHYPDRLSKRNTMGLIKEKAAEYCKGKGLDIGAGNFPLDGAIPIRDNAEQNAYKLDHDDNSLDYIFSSHCLEHLVKPFDALKLWITKIKKGGKLFLYLPHIDMELWRPGGPWVGAQHKWSPTHEVIINYFEKSGIRVLKFDDKKDEFWSWHIVGVKE